LRAITGAPSWRARFLFVRHARVAAFRQSPSFDHTPTQLVSIERRLVFRAAAPELALRTSLGFQGAFAGTCTKG
jgi:hypothetical protein